MIGCKHIYQGSPESYGCIICNEHEEKLRASLSPEWLELLVDAARIYGWEGDYIEIDDFVLWCTGDKGLSIDIEPYCDTSKEEPF